jgi:heat shock protein HslJ
MSENTGMRAGSRRRVRGGLALGAVVVVAAFVLAACGSSDSGSDATTTTKAKGEGSTSTSPSTSTTKAANGAGELDGQSFIATGIEGYEPVADSDLTVTFEDGQMAVNGGCNTLGSGYTFDDGTLKWDGEPRATMMGCSEELMAQDTWLTALFTKGVDATLDGDTLTLTQDDVTITLTAVADAPLTNTTWTLTGTIANEAISSIPADAEANPPTLTIDDDANVGVFAGCNRGSTTVEITDTTLTFSPIALTKMFCEGSAGELETHVTTVLDGETTYTVDGDTLRIMNGDQGLEYTAS